MLYKGDGGKELERACLGSHRIRIPTRIAHLRIYSFAITSNLKFVAHSQTPDASITLPDTGITQSKHRADIHYYKPCAEQPTLCFETMASGYRHGGRTESFTIDGLNPRPVKTPAPAIDTKTNNKNLRCIMCEEIQQGPSKCDAYPNVRQKVLRNPGAGDDWLQCEGCWAVRQGSCIPSLLTAMNPQTIRRDTCLRFIPLRPYRRFVFVFHNMYIGSPKARFSSSTSLD